MGLVSAFGKGVAALTFTQYFGSPSGDVTIPIIVMPGAGIVSSPKKPVPKNATTDIPFALSGLEGTVADVQVAIYLTHASTSELTLGLIHPDNTQITLVLGVGGTGDFGTPADLLIFDDSAAVTIGPINKKGRVKPSTLLAALKGKSPNGTWKLRIVNNSGAFDGSLEAGTLFVGSSAPGGGRKTVGQLWPRGNK